MVIAELRAGSPSSRRDRRRSEVARHREVSIPAAPGIDLGGRLVVPGEPLRGVIAFPHVSRGPRLNAYNRVAVRAFTDAGFAALLFDSMTPAEKVGRVLTADPLTVAKRAIAASEYLRSEPETTDLALGYFATGAGATGALSAASMLEQEVCAVVALGARSDAAAVSLERVTAAVLMIVGGSADDFECGHQICSRLECPHELVTVPGSHKLIEGDPRPLCRALQFATRWFATHLGESVSQSAGEG